MCNYNQCKLVACFDNDNWKTGQKIILPFSLTPMQKSTMAAISNINSIIIIATPMGTIVPTVIRAPTTEGIKKEKQHNYIWQH